MESNSNTCSLRGRFVLAADAASQPQGRNQPASHSGGISQPANAAESASQPPRQNHPASHCGGISQPASHRGGISQPVTAAESASQPATAAESVSHCGRISIEPLQDPFFPLKLRHSLNIRTMSKIKALPGSQVCVPKVSKDSVFDGLRRVRFFSRGLDGAGSGNRVPRTGGIEKVRVPKVPFPKVIVCFESVSMYFESVLF